MRHLRLIAFCATIGWFGTPGFGQGLYGAPEMLRLNPAPWPAAPQAAYSSPQATYPATPATAPSALAASSTLPSQAPGAVPAQPMPLTLSGPVAGYGATSAGSSPYAFDPGYPHRATPAGVAAPGGTPSPLPAKPQASPPVGTPGVSPANTSLVNRMLAEAGDGPSSGWAAGCGCSGVYPPRSPACGMEPSCCTFQPLWYASAAGLILARDHANGIWTTYETNNNPNELMRTTDAATEWRGGYDVKIGRRFGPCGCWAIEGGYWAIDRFSGQASMSLLPANTVSTPLIVSDIEFGGVNGTYFFDNAAEHRLWRTNRVQNVEISLVRRLPCDPCAMLSSWDLSLLAGVRYFNFEEELTFGSLANGGTWGGNGGLDEAYLREYVNNNLIGFQFGAEGGYRLGRTIRLFVTPKLGIYNNHIESRFDLVRGDGTHARPTPASGVTGTYPVLAEKDVFAFLGQIDVGLDWEFHPGWSAFLGYRLVAATGIALADHQIPTYVVDIHDDLADVDANGNLLVHGAFAGLKISF